MHPFPDMALLSPFEGDEIAQIQLNPYGIGFLFESGKHLAVEWRLVHVEPDGTTTSIDFRMRVHPKIALQKLLYKKIVGVEREDLTLTLRFEDGAALFVLSELGPYECGILNLPDGDFVVF